MGLDVAARDLVVGGRARTPAIAGLSLYVAGGERIALIGPSGAGKSTLLRALAAAERPREGTLRLAGLDPWALPGGALARLRRRVHLAPQTPPLPPRQRVATAVLAGRLPSRPARYALRLFVGVPDAEAAIAHAALASVGLGERLWDRVDRLSGGERQRVALARALVADAEALFVDEPLAALDPALAGRALTRLLEHAANTGATLLCSLHQVELARAAFPRVLAIRDGRTFFDGPSAALDDALVARLYAGHEEELGTLGRGARHEASDGAPNGASDGAAVEATDGARRDAGREATPGTPG